MSDHSDAINVLIGSLRRLREQPERFAKEIENIELSIELLKTAEAKLKRIEDIINDCEKSVLCNELKEIKSIIKGGE